MQPSNIHDHAINALRLYVDLVIRRYPQHAPNWPLLNGYDLKLGIYNNCIVAVFINTGNMAIQQITGMPLLTQDFIGSEIITDANKNFVRSKIETIFKLKSDDAVIFISNSVNINDELELTLKKHLITFNDNPKKIFLSHKGDDKPFVREYKQILELMGFNPWLDEDAMPAGTKLERGLKQGFLDSCAVVFFVTPNFKDTGYLETEIDYAIEEKRKKGDNFSIITLAINNGGQAGKIPELLKSYTWKQPKTQLEALSEILKGLPIKIKSIDW